MKPKSQDRLKSNSTSLKNLPWPIKILLALIILISAFILGFYISRFSFEIYCHTIAFCDPVGPTISPEMIATTAASEYELAILEIKEGKYEIAKQRLEYVVRSAPENLDAKEKLLEVEKLLQITPMP
jgi:hypothetical protein